MSTMITHPKLIAAPAESFSPELSPAVPLTIVNVTNVNVTNVSVLSISSSELPALSTGSVPREVATDSTVTVPLEESVASKESVPLKETVESTESTSPEVTFELTESVPPEATTLSLASIAPELIVESTESAPSKVTTESTVTVPLEVSVASTDLESVPLKETVESTESAHSEVTTESTESAPLKLTLEPTKSALSEVTSESTESILPKLTLEPTESTPSEVTSESTESVSPPELILESTESASSEITSESTESVPPELTKAREDAINLHRAFEGWGCDAPTIVKILAHRSATQRALIRDEYKKKFSEDLDNILSKELSGDLKRAVLLWMHDPTTRDAVLVKQGLSESIKIAQGLSENIKIAIEVICSRTPSQIERLKKAYRPIFGSSLEEDIESHASDDNKKLLLAYVGTSRSEGPEVDATMVDKDAKALFRNGEYKLGTNEEAFIRIFSERSWAHLAAVNSAYRSMYVNSLKKAVKKETSWNFKCALLTILQCAENPGKYFAKVLHKAMKGIGTDEKTLSRIIVSRAETDIQQIKAEFLKKYGKSLSNEVHSETSGNYRTFLLSLLDTNN